MKSIDCCVAATEGRHEAAFLRSAAPGADYRICLARSSAQHAAHFFEAAPPSGGPARKVHCRSDSRPEERIPNRNQRIVLYVHGDKHHAERRVARARSSVTTRLRTESGCSNVLKTCAPGTVPQRMTKLHVSTSLVVWRGPHR